MNIPAIQAQVVDVGEVVSEHSAPMFQRWHPLHYLTVQIEIVVLREIKEIGRTVVIYCDINSRQLVKTHVVITDS